MKLCMIGCGNFARRFHGPAQQHCAAQIPGLVLGGCCDVDVGRAREYRIRFGFARHYQEAGRMISSEQPDAVVVAVAPEHTCNVAVAVLARGIPVLIEKPPGQTPEELTELKKAAEVAGVGAQVAFNRRYMPVLRRTRAILDAAGNRSQVEFIKYRMLRRERWDRDFSTTAVHAIDTLRFLAGPFRSADIEYRVHQRGELEAVDVRMHLNHAAGLRAELWIQPVTESNAEEIEIHLADGLLHVRLPFPDVPFVPGSVEHRKGSEVTALYSDAGLSEIESMGIVGETIAFLDAIRSGAAPDPTLADCCEQVELMAAMRRRQVGPIQFAAR